IFRGLTNSAIYESRATATFAQEHASVPFEMTGQGASFARNEERLAYDLLSLNRLFGQSVICLEHELNRLVQVVTCFIQSFSLRIGSGKLFDEADIPLGNLLEDGGKFHG